MNERVKFTAALESWRLSKPFRITGETIQDFEVLLVTLAQGGCVGRAEAVGVSYRDDTPARMLQQLLARRGDIERGDLACVLHTLPMGGARNALDCAVWDLRAKQNSRPVWELAGLPGVRPLRTTFTLGADTPDEMAAGARAWPHAKALKLKLTGTEEDAERVRRVRAARPDVWMGVDANRGLDLRKLERLLPVLVDCKVSLLEQPFALGRDEDLRGLSCPIPIAADESIQGLQDLEERGELYAVVNIKLDKCGGLTEGLEMARHARQRGITPMVGTMGGTSLGMAAGCVVGQLCDIVDLDAPALLARDRVPSASYEDGSIWCGPGIWGDSSPVSPDVSI